MRLRLNDVVLEHEDSYVLRELLLETISYKYTKQFMDYLQNYNLVQIVAKIKQDFDTIIIMK